MTAARITQHGDGLFGPGMHDFVLRDLELGERVALAQDAEDCGFGALFDLDYALSCAAQPPAPDPPERGVPW